MSSTLTSSECAKIARLFEAAPDLLEALEDVALDYAPLCDEDDPESDGARILRKIRQAIAKAGGSK